MLKGEGGEEAGPRGWWCWAFVAGAVGPSSPFMASGVGPSSLFVSGVVVWWAFITISGWWCEALICCLWCWALVVFRGWRGWALITLFVDGGSASLCHVWVVVVRPCQFSCTWCMALVTVVVVLSSFEGESGRWSFMFVDAPSVIVLHCFCVLSSCVLAVLLSPTLLIIVPCHCCCHALIVTCCFNDDT